MESTRRTKKASQEGEHKHQDKQARKRKTTQTTYYILSSDRHGIGLRLKTRVRASHHISHSLGPPLAAAAAAVLLFHPWRRTASSALLCPQRPSTQRGARGTSRCCWSSSSQRAHRMKQTRLRKRRCHRGALNTKVRRRGLAAARGVGGTRHSKMVAPIPTTACDKGCHVQLSRRRIPTCLAQLPYRAYFSSGLVEGKEQGVVMEETEQGSGHALSLSQQRTTIATGDLRPSNNRPCIHT